MSNSHSYGFNLLGIAIGMLTYFGPSLGIDLPYALRLLGFSFALILFFIGVYHFLTPAFARWPKIEKQARLSFFIFSCAVTMSVPAFLYGRHYAQKDANKQTIAQENSSMDVPRSAFPAQVQDSSEVAPSSKPKKKKIPTNGENAGAGLPAQICTSGSACSNNQSGGVTAGTYINERLKYSLTPDQQKSLAVLLAPLSGKNIAFYISTASDNSREFGQALIWSAKAAGMLLGQEDVVFTNAPILEAMQSNISISYPDELAEEAEIFIHALKESGAYKEEVPRVPGIQGLKNSSFLNIYVEPR